MFKYFIIPVQNQWRYFLTAVMFFTRIPIYLGDFNDGDLNKATRFFPLIGILVGGFGAIIFYLCHQFLPLSLAVVISMIATVLVTGAFHEDGLADAVDGLGGGWTREQILTIMVDSRIGSYGGIALTLALLTKHQALVELSASWIPISLIAGHAISRLSAVYVMFTQEYVKLNGKSKPLATKIRRDELMIATFFGFFPLIFIPTFHYLALIPVFLTWRWFSAKIKNRIGGYTGDCLGAMQQLTEIVFYISLLATHYFYLTFNF